VYLESDERRMLRESVRRLARSYGHSYYLEVSRGDRKATELWKELGANGYLGVHIPEEYGGGGGGIAELSIVCEELAAAGTPSFMIIISQSICAELVLKVGSDAQKREWLPAMVSGESKMAFSITEPDAGLNTHNLSTVAVRDGSSYVIRGTKYYASGVDEVDRILLVARTGTDPTTGRGRLSLFLVPPDAPGLTRELIPVEMTAPEKQFTLFFDDVEVGEDALLGTEGEGLRHVFNGLNPERIMAASLESGIALYALAKAVDYAKNREVWGEPIANYQGLQHPLAKCKIDVELARLMTMHAAELHDAGEDAGMAANMAKYAAAEACLAALDQAIQTHGGNGMSTEYGLATLWGVARLQRTAPVSREMILNYVAQHGLGLPRSY
jgi:alkylation response protein AidB-like acyl-CoA dehydrogenase